MANPSLPRAPFASRLRLAVMGTPWTAWLEDRFEIGHGRGKQIPGMEGLRGVAVLLVFWVHYFGMVMPWTAEGSLFFELGQSVWSLGHAGVDLFFIISGYLIYGSLISRRRSITRYLKRRVERIYPTFLAVLGLYLILSWVFPSQNKIPTSPAPAALYIIQNLFLLPGVFAIDPIITVSWSLSYEFFFYLIAPVAIVVLSLRDWNRTARAAFLVVGICAVFMAVHLAGGHIRMVMFLGGALLFELRYLAQRLEGGFAEGLTLLWTIGGFAVIVALEQHQAPALWRYAVLLIVFLPLCGVTFQDGTLPSQLFSWRPLRWLGNMSYSYYLIHGVTLKGVFLLLAVVAPPASAWPVLPILLLPLSLIATLVTGAILFLVVERRFSLRATAPNSAAVNPCGEVEGQMLVQSSVGK